MSMFNPVHFSSRYLNWRTPENIYNELDREFKFNFDPCPPNPEFDGLTIPWKSSNFVNPPYGRKIKDWIRKGYEESLKNKTVVFLIPSRTDTSWWHDYVMLAKEIRFIRGRIRFSDYHNGAPFPSCIAIFKGESKNGKDL